MRKTALLLFILGVLTILTATIAFANGPNAALVVKLDEGCSWFGNSLEAEGSVHYVETQNGKWTLSCKGEVTGYAPDQAFQLKSTPSDPIGLCFTPFGSTYQWHMVFTPSGKSSFVCQGDLTP